MKRLQNFYLYSYRLIGFIFLMGLVASILWYGITVLFFIINSSWSVPHILSPDQEKVMIHLEHVLTLEHELAKSTAELLAAKASLKSKQVLLKNTQDLYLRFEKSMRLEAKQHAQTSQRFNELTAEEIHQVDELNRLSSAVQHKETEIEKELKVGLITKQDALAQYIALANMQSALLGAKTKAAELQQQARDFITSANTLRGAANNVNAMQTVVKKMELDRQLTQLTTDIYGLTVNVHHLEKNIKKRKTALALMKNSPYILATRKPTSVAFVPYSNLSHARVGQPVYSCYLDMVFCYQSGHVVSIYKAEEYAKHPIFKSDLKGEFIGIVFNHEADAQKKLLFLNSKPLLI